MKKHVFKPLIFLTTGTVLFTVDLKKKKKKKLIFFHTKAKPEACQ